MPITLEFMAHFKFIRPNQKGPYIILGPNIQIPITKEIDRNGVYSTTRNIAFDVGVGFNKKFNFLNFAPELRFSTGLVDINEHPQLGESRFHNLILVLNFID